MSDMASDRAIRFIFSALVLCMEFSVVAAQVPVLNPDPPGVPGVLQPQEQVTNMIEALRDAGQFGAVAGLLEGLEMKSLTPMTTWFMPNDDAFSGNNYPKNVTKFLDYHVIRELLPFSRLLTLGVGTRLPTFLGSETSVVTNNQQLNYSLDNAMVIVPDLYSDNTVAVHGLNAVLDDARYNRITNAPIPAPVSSPPVSPRAPAGAPPTASPLLVPSPNVAPPDLSPRALPPVRPSSREPMINITFSDSAHRYRLSATTGICILFATLLVDAALL